MDFCYVQVKQTKVDSQVCCIWWTEETDNVATFANIQQFTKDIL